MRYTVPHYYNQFQCTASECPDTCCAGWQIMIDDKTLEKYKKVKGPFGNRLHNSIDWKEGAFQQYDGRCAFLNEENLCDIYTEIGHHMFCKTCRTYPRHIEEFEGEREISLSLSCPEAAKLILGCDEKVRFVTKEKNVPEQENADFDFFLYDKLLDIRETAIEILQNREVDIWTRVSMVLALAHDTERKIHSQELFQVDDVLSRYKALGAAERFEKRIEEYRVTGAKRYAYIKEMMKVFGKLEVLKKDWPDILEKLEKALFEQGSDGYCENRECFRKEVLEQHHWTEQLMVYFVFTYFCGAVYDERAYAKMKMAVVSTLLIEELAQGIWQRNGKTLDFMEFVDIAHRYSREVEHSDDNLNVLEKTVEKVKIFGLENLLRVIG